LISSGVLIKDILDGGKLFTILEKQYDNIYIGRRSPVGVD